MTTEDHERWVLRDHDVHPREGRCGTPTSSLEIYRKCPGEPPTRESALALLENNFFKPKRYDLAKVGRYKVNRKLGLGTDGHGPTTLTEQDILTTIEYLVRLHSGEKSMLSPDSVEVPLGTDDIDHFATVACAPWASSSRTRSGSACPHGRVVRERMTTQDVESISRPP